MSCVFYRFKDKGEKKKENKIIKNEICATIDKDSFYYYRRDLCV